MKVRGGDVMIILDKEKGYDCIEWGFLNNMLFYMVFNSNFQSMVAHLFYNCSSRYY